MKASKSKSFPSHGTKEVNGKWIPMTNKGAFGQSAAQKRENKKRKERRS